MNRNRGKNQAVGGKPVWLGYVLLAVALLLVTLGVIKLLDNRQGQDAGEPVQADVTKPVATIEMEGGGVIRVELDPHNAPNTVRNFIHLAGQGFYDGLVFHRVIDNFMIQGGCPDGTGTGGPGYRIKGEFSARGHNNRLIHERGVISMARSSQLDSAGSQFFITVAAVSHLDGQYAAFGRVIEGMEEVDRISRVERDRNDRPLQDQRIKSLTVDTFGGTYGPPDKL